MTQDNHHCRLVQADPSGTTWQDETRVHAQACPACTAFLDCTAEIRHRLALLPSGREQMPAGLRAEMLAKLAACAEQGRSASRKAAVSRILVPMAMAASLVLGVFLQKNYEVGGIPSHGEVKATVGAYISDVAHDHYLIERLARPLEVHISDAATLSQWLTSALNFAFDAPPTQADFVLEGGRVWHTVGRLSAMASYRTPSGGRAILFAVPARSMTLEGAPSTTIGETVVYSGRDWGQEARVWFQGDLAVALTAPEGKLPADWAEVFLP